MDSSVMGPPAVGKRPLGEQNINLFYTTEAWPKTGQAVAILWNPTPRRKRTEPIVAIAATTGPLAVNAGLA